MKIRVRCSYEVEVEWDESWGDHYYFQIEENGCPWTGIVGAAFDEIYGPGKDEGICHCGSLKAENKIICVGDDIIDITPEQPKQLLAAKNDS